MIRAQRYIVWFISAALVAVAVFYAVKVFRKTDTGLDPEIAACLKSKGLKFYGTYSCSNCLEQKKILGGYLKSVLYIECTQNPVLCENANIKRVPTWEFLDGSRHEGVLQINDLLSRIECASTSQPIISPVPTL